MQDKVSTKSIPCKFYDYGIAGRLWEALETCSQLEANYAPLRMGTLLWFIYYLTETQKVRKKEREERTVSLGQSITIFAPLRWPPLNLLRDCHFCASANEDSSEIQFYLVFQPVGTSGVSAFYSCRSYPFPFPPVPVSLIPSPLHLPDRPPLGPRVISVRNLRRSLPSPKLRMRDPGSA